MEKAEKFFERLSKNSVSKTLSWFLIGLFLFISLISSLIPAQEIFSLKKCAGMLFRMSGA